MKYPSTAGMKQRHWDAIQQYCDPHLGVSIKWEEGSYCWKVTDKHRFVFKAKQLPDAVQKMVEHNLEMERIAKNRDKYLQTKQ